MNNKNNTGTLYLIPSFLGEGQGIEHISAYNAEIINSIDFFIVEEIRTARRFLKAIRYPKPFDTVSFEIYNEHNLKTNIDTLIAPLLNGSNAGILSEAGCPAVADPGSLIVAACHKKNIKVVPLTGPSSILLALMASGLNGQHFTFNGYLPKESNMRSKQIKQMEQQVIKSNISQLFIEAPYRNAHLLDAILENCNSGTMLCIAVNITLPNEFIKTASIAEWKKNKPEINKFPALFILGK